VPVDPDEPDVPDEPCPEVTVAHPSCADGNVISMVFELTYSTSSIKIKL